MNKKKKVLDRNNNFPIQQEKERKKNLEKLWKVWGFRWFCWMGVYVYFELKSPSKSISMTNPSKCADFWIPVEILKMTPPKKKIL
jgi:hypothetical protein